MQIVRRAVKSSIPREADEPVSVPSRQTPSTQSQPDAPLQSELLPELTGTAHSPPPEHIGTPPSTVDTAALSEEPLPGEGRRPRPPDVCVHSYVGRKCESNSEMLQVTDCSGGLVSLTTDLRVKYNILLPPPPHLLII